MEETQLLEGGINPDDTGEHQPQEGDDELNYKELYEKERKKKYEFMNKYHTLRESYQAPQEQPTYGYSEQEDEYRRVAREEAERVQQTYAQQQREMKEWKSALKSNPDVLDFEDEIREVRRLNPNLSISTAYKIVNPGAYVQQPQQPKQERPPSMSTKPSSDSTQKVDFATMSADQIKEWYMNNR